MNLGLCYNLLWSAKGKLKMTERAKLLFARLQELDEAERERLSGILLGVLDDEMDDDFPVGEHVNQYIDEDGNIDFEWLRANCVPLEIPENLDAEID
jgi:hypothetical protein